MSGIDPAPADPQRRAVDGVLAITSDDAARVMHEAWCARKRAEGWHGRDFCGRKMKYGMVCGVVNEVGGTSACDSFMTGLEPWDDLPESVRAQKREEVEPVLAELRRRAGVGGDNVTLHGSGL